MATIYDLKPAFQNLLRPVCRWLAMRGVTANQITLAAAFLSTLHGLWIALAPSFLALVLLPLTLFIRMGLNAIDGMLAREHNQKSQLGAVLNELGDVYSDSILYLPLGFVTPLPLIGIVAFVIVGIFTEMAGVIAQVLTGQRRYDGPFGKSDRAFVIGTVSFFSALGFLTDLLPLIIWIGVLLGLVTLWRRAARAAGR